MLLLGSAERILGPLTETWNGYPAPEGLYLQQLLFAISLSHKEILFVLVQASVLS